MGGGEGGGLLEDKGMFLLGGKIVLDTNDGQ